MIPALQLLLPSKYHKKFLCFFMVHTYLYHFLPGNCPDYIFLHLPPSEGIVEQSENETKSNVMFFEFLYNK